VADDLVLVCPIRDGEYVVHPMPTCSECLDGGGRSWDVQRYLPLMGIFHLVQAGSDEAEPIGEGAAALNMTERATEMYRNWWNRMDDDHEARKQRRQVFENACAAAQSVPGFDLRFTRDGRFWEAVEGALASAAEPISR
jgi:SynChlorMet cassette protein ScmC